jgi:histidine triad (HIT) family protein
MSECLFCKIVNKEIPADIVYENDYVMAFKDINPKAPVHILVVPKKHISTYNDITPDDTELLGKITEAVQTIAKDFNIAEKGYRVLVNVNKEGGQVIFHLHVHILGGKLFKFEKD